VPLSSYHRAFQPTRGIFLPAGDDSLAAAHPLCGSFSFAAASAAPGRAFLAVGTNDGSIVLRDMSGLAAEPVGLSNYEEMAYGAADDAENSATFRWKACQGSVFDVAWRADDRALVAGGSDYVMRTWDTATLVSIAKYDSCSTLTSALAATNGRLFRPARLAAQRDVGPELSVRLRFPLCWTRWRDPPL
jgi:hypothetical protein